MIMKKRAITLILPFVLGACGATTVKGLQERAPVLTADSRREGSTIIACVSTAWLQLGGATPKSVPRETGAMLVLGDAVPMLLVETTTTASGTHVVMHQFKTIWSDADRRRVEEVRACL